MKIAVSASGTGPAAQVDPRFGRCVHFVFYDPVAGAYEAGVTNTGATASGGSGIQAAQGVVNAGADIVLTGHIGPNAFRVLEAAGIKCYTGVGGTVEGFIAAYQAGELKLVSGATVMPHAGSGRGMGRGGGRGGTGKGGRTF